MACELSDVVSSVVTQELEDWLSCNTEGTIVLVEVRGEEVDVCTVILLLGTLYEVKLHIPSGYPKHADSFLVETDDSLIQTWAIALNEYLVTCDHKLRVTDVLDKAVQLYSKSDTIKPSSKVDEDEDVEDSTETEESEDASLEYVEDGMDLADDDTFTTKWDLIIARKKVRWLAKEQQVRQEMEIEQGKHDSDPHHKAARQIFTSSAACGILINDLIKIMECEQTCGFSAEPIEDNIYHWRVRLASFQQGSELMKDLQELNKIHSYDYIEMEMTFAIGLFPFYPPLVKIVRPRLQGSMMQRISNFESLQLSFWSPARDMKSIIEGIRDFLQQWARVEVHNERNQLSRCPYLDIEHHLLTLAQVSELSPRANQMYLLDEGRKQEMKTAAQKQSLGPLDSIETMLESAEGQDVNKPGLNSPWRQSKESRCEQKKRKTEEYWAKGVGFGHNNRPTWDINTYLVAKKEKDKKIVAALEDVLKELKLLGTSTTSTTHSTKMHVGNQSAAYQREAGAQQFVCQNEAGTSGQCSSREPSSYISDMYSVLEGSVLVPCIEHHLKVDSFLEISQHSMVYSVIINVIREIAYRRELLPLLCCLPKQETSVFQLLDNLVKMASLMLRQLEKPANGALSGNCHQPVVDSDSSDSDTLMDSQCLDQILKKKWKCVQSGAASKKSTVRSNHEEKLAREFVVLSKLVNPRLENAGLLGQCQSCHTAEVHTNTEAAAGGEPASPTMNGIISPVQLYGFREAQYVQQMKTLQFKSIDIPTEGFHAHHFSKVKSPSHSQSSKTQVIRIVQELSSLSTSLPLDLSSAIFIRTDEDKISFMQVLITGPEGTPYSSGCFTFDVSFPSTYPMVPPKVHLRTTGNGTVRFNPNLYHCGTVCLSLLGTWMGQNGEEWNEKTSTVLQVLVSIQSLILVPDPYFNEPGFEQSMNTKTGKQQSKEYNKSIRIHTINHAMIAQLQNPQPGFEDVIRAHFYLKQELILQEVKDWLKEDKCPRLESAVKGLKKELAKLERPKSIKVT